MEKITIHSTDFNINNQNSIDAFTKKLRKITEPFEVNFSFSIKIIPDDIFSSTNLAKITIPDSVTKIGSYAFYSCKNLTEISLPDSITEVEDDAFDCCYHLKNIIFPKNIDFTKCFAFEGTGWYQDNYANKPVVCIKDVLYSADNFNETVFCINDKVTKIARSTFRYNDCVETIFLPSTITDISNRIIENCSNLKEIHLPENLKKICNYFYRDCYALEKIVIPSSKKDFLKNVTGAKDFLNTYEKLIYFDNKSLDDLLTENNSLEQVINNLEER